MIKIPFLPQKYDYIFVRGLVYRNSKQVMVNFLLDTGASTTMIDPDIMKNIGYSDDCEEYVKPATVSGPSGREIGYRVKVQKLLVHSMECVIPDLDVICIRPEKSVDALLGVNFLKNFHYCVDHKEHLLTLRKH